MKRTALTSIFTALIVLFIFQSCTVNFSWTEKRLDDLWAVKPTNIDECMDRLDTLLNDKARNNFIQLPEQVAVIEICRDLGLGFISGWHLRPSVNPYDKKKYPLTDAFNRVGIVEPAEMIRIIFTCYHRKLKTGTTDFENVINLYKSFWIRNYPPHYPGYGYYLSLVSEPMKQFEDSIINKHYFDHRYLNDTLIASFFYEEYRFNKKPMQYGVEGVIIHKDSLTNQLSVQLVTIENSKNTGVWWQDKNTERKVGDTLTMKASRWYKKGEARFRYW